MVDLHHGEERPVPTPNRVLKEGTPDPSREKGDNDTPTFFYKGLNGHQKKGQGVVVGRGLLPLDSLLHTPCLLRTTLTSQMGTLVEVGTGYLLSKELN